MSKPVIELQNVSKCFKRSLQQDLLVLNNINLTIHEGEIVALLGKSGSGKSTLLRIIAGLIAPSSGKVFYKNTPVISPVQGIAMVFQSFALMPWLTVLNNVELGLEALGINPQERRQRALKAIDTIGLDGFESAYPKELSGGMKQRVGIARALVVKPELLLLDEAFSALDVLTAENLRTDLIDLWQEENPLIKSVLQVTHNIEEAVTMANRIIIFSSDPGEIKSEIKVNLPFPRDLSDPKVRDLIEEVYSEMTRKKAAATAVPLAVYTRLPDVEVSVLTGLIETISFVKDNEERELPQLADDLHLDIDDLFPLIEALEQLKFAHVRHGQLHPTTIGRLFADADILEKKQIFAKQLAQNIPLANYITEELHKENTQRIPEEFFVEKLAENLSDEEAQRVLRTIIDWGRYAELFAYDFNSKELSLENPN